MHRGMSKPINNGHNRPPESTKKPIDTGRPFTKDFTVV